MSLFDNIYKGNIEGIKDLLDKGSDPNEVSFYGYTPLMYAIAYKSINMITLLLQYGADINMENTKANITPLQYAREKKDIVEFLLLNGANPNYINGNGDSALSLCIKEKRYDVAKLLILYGATH